MNWLVQKDKLYGQKVKAFGDLVGTEATLLRTESQPICNLAGTEGKVVRTERRIFFVIWLVQKDKLYGQKVEAF